ERLMDTPLVEAIDVHRIYRPSATVEVHALRGVSLSIHRGDSLAIIGPSGSGKSTMLNLLGALDRPTSGSMLFGGRDVNNLSDVDLARLRNEQIGFVFQSFHLLSRATALDNVALPLVYRGLGRRERRERAHAALAAVGLADRVDHRPNELSGGQQQRVAIARAMVTEADMLLADEPTGNLDTRTGTEVLELLTSLQADRGAALVVITHDQLVADMVDQVIETRDGVLEQPARTGRRS
ncbi:MAG: ABC transporter ATP-binding protein, partial [Nitriliruptorales bacterium]|nr:ABC transporter ATP-binding protein [Nitriliruptorales bacterium]